MLPVTKDRLSSLLETQNDINFGRVKTCVRPKYNFWMIFTLDLALNYTDKLFVFRFLNHPNCGTLPLFWWIYMHVVYRINICGKYDSSFGKFSGCGHVYALTNSTKKLSQIKRPPAAVITRK